MTICRTRLAPTLLTGAAMMVVLGAQPLSAAAQPKAQVHFANARPIDRSPQRAHCYAQFRVLKQTTGLADGQSDQAFMKTCLADVNPVAVLPRPAAVMNAQVGSTGVCEDGTYSFAVRRDGACTAHGGLSRRFGP